MTSQVDVVNLALTKLGQDRIISIADENEPARVMRSLWDITRDSVMADHPWTFAIIRAELAALADAPLNTWSLQYQLPESCLRLVQVGTDWVFYSHDGIPWFDIEGKKILCDEAAPLPVRYVSRVENVGLWPPLFARAVAMQLAADACEKLTGSNNKAERALVELDAVIRKAKQASAIERPPQRLTESAWLRARGD